MHGADLIVLRRCYSCHAWPYTHRPGCPVAAARDAERARLLKVMTDALPAQSVTTEEPS